MKEKNYLHYTVDDYLEAKFEEIYEETLCCGIDLIGMIEKGAFGSVNKFNY